MTPNGPGSTGPGLGLLDTSWGSLNDGDGIIVEAAESALGVGAVHSTPRFPTHLTLLPAQRAEIAGLHTLVFMGTNVLSGNFWRRRQWMIGPLSARVMWKKVAFMGVGWSDDRTQVDRITPPLLRGLIREGLPIGARDRFTAELLTRSGVPAEYIGCPTMWNLPPETSGLGEETEVVATITDYRPDPPADLRWLAVLRTAFRRVLLWPQSLADQDYMARLSRLGADFTALPPGLQCFSASVRGRAYVGTRLHAGVRALQVGSPALVIEVDNRAREIAGDTHLPTVARSASAPEIHRAIGAMTHSTRLAIPKVAAQSWLASLAGS